MAKKGYEWSTFDRWAQIIDSPRFQQLLGIWFLQTMAYYFPGLEFLANSLSVFLGGTLVVGTTDSIAKKLGGN